MASVQADILSADEELTHELIYSQVIADTIISITVTCSP